MRKALVHTATGKVVNLIEIDPGSTFSVVDHTLMDATGAEIGGTWNGTAFSPAPAPPSPDPQIATDKNTVTSFMNNASGTATNVQRDDTIKAVIRYLRRAGNDA